MSRWLALATLVAALDQLSKYAIRQSLALGSSIDMTPFFNVVLVYNTGAAFSFLSSAAGWQRELFIAIAVAASIWVVFLLRRHPGQTLFCLALSLILGGAIGNVIDRVLLGAVVDFLDFHVAGAHFPAFNVADSAITCGAVLMIWESLRAPADGKRNGNP